MRVLHVYAGNLYGGIETLLVTLARHRGLCPEVDAHFALCFEGRLSAELRGAGVPIHMLGPARTSRPWTVWKVRRRLSRVLRRWPFQAVICHSFWPHALFAPVVRSRGCPLVFWAHDRPCGRHWLETWARRTRPDLVVANSQFTGSAVPILFGGVPLEVLRSPAPAPALRDRDLIRLQVRAELQTPPGSTVILQPSRLERWKGHTLLLQALGKLRDCPGWVCWVTGSPQRPQETAYFQEIQGLATTLRIQERVRFLGYRSDITQVLTSADIHCQPNLGGEPLGLSFVEGLYAGLPVVTTALGGALEIVDNTCGVLVPPQDAHALAEALRQLIRDEARRRALGSAGPARAQALCDPAVQMPRLERILGQVVQRHVAV